LAGASISNGSERVFAQAIRTDTAERDSVIIAAGPQATIERDCQSSPVSSYPAEPTPCRALAMFEEALTIIQVSSKMKPRQ
jgi:hypothetical protein